jgi:hypothetical protein
MKRAMALGILLLILGLVALLHPNFDYHKREELAKIGPVTATVEKPERTTIPPAAAAALLIAGAVLTAVSTRLK